MFLLIQSSATGKAGGLKESEQLEAVKNLEPPKSQDCQSERLPVESSNSIIEPFTKWRFECLNPAFCY